MSNETTLFQAVSIWVKAASRAQVCRAVGVAAVLLVVVFVAGGLGGRFLSPRTHVQVETVVKTVTVHDVETKTVTVDRPVVQWRTKYVEVTKFDPTTGHVIETRKSGETDGKTKEGSTTTTEVSDKGSTKSDSVSKTETNPEGRWSVRVLAGANLAGGVVAGAGADYRLLGPLTVGLWVTVPVAGSLTSTSAGASLGLRF